MQIKFTLQLLSLLTLSFFLFFPKKINAQDCSNSLARKKLSGNNIQATITNSGSLFRDFQDAGFTVPMTQNISVSTIFAGGLWIGAKDAQNNLMLAATTYAGSEYAPAGPIFNNNGMLSFDCDNYAQLWEVFGYEIQQHISDFEDNGVIDNPIQNIFGYPAHQNPFFENIYGFTLPNTPQGLAPFFDKNADGIYNPENGDYPLPNSVNENSIPAHIIWGVFNYGVNAQMGSPVDPLNVEVQLTTWSFYCSDNPILDNSIFTSHKIINRHNISLDSMTVGLWTDFDLGCYTDDYIGCAPDLNTYYVYNSDPIDGTTGAQCDQGISTYADNPPVQAATFLNKQMSSFVSTSNASVGNPNPCGTGDPINPEEFYNVLTGLFPNGTPITEGGYGCGGTTETSFIYPGNPNDPQGWSLHNVQLPSLVDYRSVSSVYVGSLPPGAVTTFDMAYTFYQDDNLNNIETVNMVYDNTPLLQQMYDDGFPINCNADICIDDCVWVGDADRDSIVTGYDFLQLGLGFDEQGDARNTPLVWNPYKGENWVNNVNNINFKHTDCDGNGEINGADFQWVNTMYQNSYKTIPFVDEYPYGDEMSLTSNPSYPMDSISIGSQGRINVELNQQEEIYGLTYTLEYDPERLELFIPIDFLTDIWESSQSDFLDKKLFEDDGEIHFANVKLDHVNGLTKLGSIGYIRFRAKDSNYALTQTLIRLKNIKAISSDGTDLDYGAKDFLVNIINPNGYGTFVSNEDLEENNIQVFPNPTTDLLNIKLEHSSALQISVFDVYGKKVFEKSEYSKKDFQISTSSLSSGIYYLKLLIDGKEQVHKFTKM